MKRRRLPNHRAQSQAHHKRTDAYVDALIEDLRRQSLDSALLLAELVHYDGTEELYFDHVPQIRQAVQRIRLTYADRLRLGIASAVRREWNIASKGQDDFVAKALNAYGLQDEDGKYYPKNEDALQAFTKRREQGLKLSERVWDLSGEHMQSLERAISTAVHDGWSAQTLSKRVSQYLKDFPKLKQDYTERFGKAIDIQDCEYKSARLARTEINMAYREAERTRWQELDFVTGYEVKRSGRQYDCEVCASLAGKYPKDFKWAGWHPNCRCYALPILSTEDEFWASFESDSPTPSSNEVADVPENFKQWLAENADRHARSKARGTEPYFLRDNPKYTAGNSPTPKPEQSPTPSAPATPPKPSIAERAQARHNARTPQQIADIQKRWDERRELMKAYHAHPADEWEHTAIYPKAGGYVVTSKERIKEGKRNSREREIFEKELAMCHTCAMKGHRVEYLSSANREKGATFDILFDGKPADLKSITSPNNLVKQLKHALREQGAEVAVVELDNGSDLLYNKIIEARRKIEHGVICYYVKGKPDSFTKLER